jgi:hypothetical protein
VTLINTDGMSFIGPGSEWFWTALTGLVLGLTFFAIYRQLRLQARTGAIEQMDAFMTRREAYSESMMRYGLDVMTALRDHDDPADIPEAAVLGLGDFWANFATLARAGHRDAALLWQSDSESPQIIWWWIAPFVFKTRIESRLGVPSYADFEWLVGVLAEMDRAGGRPAITQAVVMSDLDHLISLHRDLIRYAQAVRSSEA